MLNENLFNKNGHLKESAFLMEEQNALTEEESYLFLCHIENCGECMEKYLEYISETELIEPSQELLSGISEGVKKVREKRSEKKALIIQFVKLAVAVSLTMVLFFGGIADRIVNLTEEQIKFEIPQRQEQENKKDNAFREIGESFNRYFFETADLINNSFRGDAKNERKSTTNQPETEK